MNLTHESMMSLTADMPMKEIVINGDAYLQRYFAHTLADGTQLWYHRFLRNDSEEHLHSHPWESRSTILVGRYTEQRSIFGNYCHIEYRVGESNFIQHDTLHRIIKVEPDTWTMMLVAPGRADTWHFIEEDGSKVEMPASPFEWHQDFKPRGAQP